MADSYIKSAMKRFSQWYGVLPFPQKLSLRLLLIAPFILEVSIAVGLTGYLSLRNGQRAVNDLVSNLQQEVSNRVDQHLDSYLAVPPKLSQFNADAIERGFIDPSNLEQVGRFFWQQVRLNSVGYILFGSTTGELAATGYYADDVPLTIATLSPQTRGNRNSYAYETDAQGNPTRLNFVFENFAFQNEAWYAKTMAERRPVWTDIYQWESEPYPLSISAGYPVYDSSRRLVGAIGVDLRLAQISQFLRQITISPGSKIFVMERNGLLVATSNVDQPLYTLNQGKPQRVQAADSTDPIIQATATQLTETFQNLTQIRDQQQISFTLDNKREFVQVTPWRDSLGLDWLVVVAVPEADFVTPIRDNTRTTILLCLLSLAGAVVLGIYTSRWIAQPILRLSQASEILSESAQQGFAAHPSDPIIYDSTVEEINILAQSFKRMAEQLREAFVQLEKTNEELETRVDDRTRALSETLERLKLTQTQLVQTEKMSSLGQLVAGVAHEINNPVNFIHGNLSHAEEYISDLLKLVYLYQSVHPNVNVEVQKTLDEIDFDFLCTDLPKLLDSMKIGTTRIREIVLSLRTFSRLDEAEMKAIDIHEGIDSTLMILASRLKQKNSRDAIQVIKQYDNLPPVQCHAGRLNQVFMNLLTNAIDALEEAAKEQFHRADWRPQIWVTTLLRENHDVVVQIRDNAKGIPSKTLAKIFDPFFTTKSVGKGTGLGLSISYQIVTQHGGNLFCRSIMGEGTEFTVEIPLEKQKQVGSKQ